MTAYGKDTSFHIFSAAVSLCFLKMVTKPLQRDTEWFFDVGRGFEFQGQEVDVDTDWREMVGCENSRSDADLTPKTHVARNYRIRTQGQATLEVSYVP